MKIPAEILAVGGTVTFSLSLPKINEYLSLISPILTFAVGITTLVWMLYRIKNEIKSSKKKKK